MNEYTRWILTPSTFDLISTMKLEVWIELNKYTNHVANHLQFTDRLQQQLLINEILRNMQERYNDQ